MQAAHSASVTQIVWKTVCLNGLIKLLAASRELVMFFIWFSKNKEVKVKSLFLSLENKETKTRKSACTPLCPS